MKKNIKEEVYKCSKCGLCQSVCPIYIATKNEMYLSRGRYIVLNNFYNNNKPLTKEFIKNSDICLNCNECKRFCPSGIDMREILTRIKFENNFKYSALSFPYIYKIILNILRIFKIIYKCFPLKSIFLNTFIDSLFDIKVTKKRQNRNETNENVVYFEGCVNKYINPSDKNASVNLLNKLGYNVINVNSNCCGLPYLSDGNINEFNKNSKRIVSSIPENTKYIVCSCNSCFDTLNKIPELKDKIITIDEIIKMHALNVEHNDNAVFFKPVSTERICYLPSEMNIINKKGTCSLMENYFLLKYPKIAKQILKNNFYKKQELDNKIIVTSCNLTLVGLKRCISIINSNAKVYTYAEYVNLLTK
ncbi:(Fe-S)-binding protein [bacterium]|nr:(Fe-S)-binding protein [bacterium]